METILLFFSCSSMFCLCLLRNLFKGDFLLHMTGQIKSTISSTSEGILKDHPCVLATLGQQLLAKNHSLDSPDR